MNTTQLAIGYLSRKNFAIFNLAYEYSDNEMFDLCGGGCLDAPSRIAAGSVECDPLDSVPFPTVAFR